MERDHRRRVGQAAAEVALRLQWDSVLLGFVGLHHDDIEDERATLADFERYGRPACRLLDCLTRRSGEVYAVYIDRVCELPAAIVVKACDINDNMLRGVGPPGDLRKRYVRAWARLERGWAAFEMGAFPVAKAWRD